MEITKYTPIDEQHRAGVEVDGNRVLLWIETKKKGWFGRYYFDRCTRPTLFSLIEGKDRLGCSIQGGFLGRLMTLQDNERNIDTFDLEVEIAKAFHDYMTYVDSKNKLDKKLSQFISTI